MKFVADVNIEKSIIDEIKNLGYDVKWITDINPIMDDTEVLRLANDEERILITNDKDFGEIIFRQKKVASGIILFRVKKQDPQEKVRLVKKLLIFYKDKIQNHFIVVSNNKIRSLPLDHYPLKEV